MNLIMVIFFGLCIGSFLNVCIYRVPRRLSVTKPKRSFCPECETQLSCWENIPVLSWIALRAKCKHCGKSISGQYPFVEILTAIAAVASYLQFGLTPTGALVFALTSALIAITFIDLEFKIIPNVISFPGMIIGFGIAIVSQYTDYFSWPITQGALDSIIGFIAGGGFFYAIGILYYAATKRVGLGGGDIKLMGMTGAILGWQSIVPTIFAGSLFGAVIGILTIIFRGGGRHTEIPFGPWLSLGTVLYMFVNVEYFSISLRGLSF